MGFWNNSRFTESGDSQVCNVSYAGLYKHARKNTITCLEQIKAFYTENPHVEIKNIPLNHIFILMLKDVKSLSHIVKGKYGRINQNDLLGFLFFVEIFDMQNNESDISISRFIFLWGIFQYLIMHSIAGGKRFENVKLFKLDDYDELYPDIKNETTPMS